MYQFISSIVYFHFYTYYVWFYSFFYFRIFVVCAGVVLVLSSNFPPFSVSEVILNQQPYTVDLAEQLYWNKAQNVPYVNRSITEKTPTEVRHIGFLKVHKAGRTTMQNIFFRFGLKRNLTFVIARDRNYLNFSSSLPVKKGGHYDILAVHTVNGFNKEQFDQILPPDKVNIGIVREPLGRMISAAYYYSDQYNISHLRFIPQGNFIQELVSHPEKYDKGAFSETRNSMGKDFGFDLNTRESDIDAILQKLRFLEKEFRLVLVMERFEESLVLFKRYLGWQISDVLYIPSNTNVHASTNLTEEQMLKHRHTCFLDYAIYDFFSTIFDYKIKAEGPTFQDEVRYFRDILRQINTFCIQPRTVDDRFIVKTSKWNSEFQVLRSDCELMLLEETEFIQRLWTRHIQMNRQPE